MRLFYRCERAAIATIAALVLWHRVPVYPMEFSPLGPFIAYSILVALMLQLRRP